VLAAFAFLSSNEYSRRRDDAAKSADRDLVRFAESAMVSPAHLKRTWRLAQRPRGRGG